MTDLLMAKQHLNSGTYTCVLCCGEKTYYSEHRGVRPLMEWLEGGTELKGFSAADKVVGKATAFLYILLGVTAVYARVISRSALQLLQQHGITAEYDTLAENIINRKGDGICPFEAAVLNVDDPEEAFRVICHKRQELSMG